MREQRYYIAIAATLFAVLVWGSVKLGGQFQTVRDVTVVFTNVPDGFAPSKPLPRTVRLTVRGTGWDLAGEWWDSDVVLDIDVQSDTPVRTVRDIREMFVLPESIELVSMKPESIVVRLEPEAEKRVPVVLSGLPDYAEGYGLSGHPSILPESVTVRGAASVVQKMQAWETLFSSGQGALRSSFEQRIGLADSAVYLLSVIPGSVTVRLNVQPLAEKSLEGITVEVLSAPGDREVILIPPKVDLLVRGAIDQLAALTADDCRVTVDYEAILRDTLRTVTPSVELPEGLSAIGRTPEHLQYVIRERLVPAGPDSQQLE